MTDQSTLQPGDRVVSLAAMSRSSGLASSLAAAIAYQIAFGSTDFLTMGLLFVPAVVIGFLIGTLIGRMYSTPGSDGATTIVRHGKGGLPITLRLAVIIAGLISVALIIFAVAALGFEGALPALIAVIAIPAVVVGAFWAAMASLA